ncbi:Hypothetical protein Ccan_02720 [Capnocytophaga canimorsus Cc5]|uniref:Uncharacterized protein n=1 Tax=Capnocytophaga canimorsus (strain 5) TaxID=860228 RepID=F9YQV7_CAPCC|nr:Hypothetical protein Ccan_02720 [Capnocytophaga canimorsus Cc5]
MYCFLLFQNLLKNHIKNIRLECTEVKCNYTFSVGEIGFFRLQNRGNIQKRKIQQFG